jgi:hypothetical protein
MSSVELRSLVVSLIVMAGLLIAVAPASAGTFVGNPT